MTPEEIKKISDAYAEAMCPVGDYCGGVYDDQRNTDLPIYKDDAKSVLEWLSKDYCIVPKSKINTLHEEIHGEIMCAHDDDDWQSAAHYILDVMPRSFSDIFGSRLFDEEKL